MDLFYRMEWPCHSVIFNLTIYASNGIMKVGQVESGVPMLYTLEKLTDEVIK